MNIFFNVAQDSVVRTKFLTQRASSSMGLPLLILFKISILTTQMFSDII